jgi:hypothetical protein
VRGNSHDANENKQMRQPTPKRRQKRADIDLDVCFRGRLAAHGKTQFWARASMIRAYGNHIVNKPLPARYFLLALLNDCLMPEDHLGGATLCIYAALTIAPE